jgi:acyl-CoA thioesterase II
VIDTLPALVDLLDLEPIEVNIFRGHNPAVRIRDRVYGGQVAAQALMAAARTVDPSRFVHSSHVYFLRPGDPDTPILYEVDRIRDGRSFTTRRVVAIQHGEAILNLAASFQREEPGYEWHQPMPDAAAPESLPTPAEHFASEGELWQQGPRAIDIRHEPSRQGGQRIWIRADGELPDDPVLHACVATYVSDIAMVGTMLLPHGVGWQDGLITASLDHVMWFHRRFRADDWMLYDLVTPSSSGGRGLTYGSMYSSDGELAITLLQEGLIRPDRTNRGGGDTPARGGADGPAS